MLIILGKVLYRILYAIVWILGIILFFDNISFEHFEEGFKEIVC